MHPPTILGNNFFIETRHKRKLSVGNSERLSRLEVKGQGYEVKCTFSAKR